MAERYDAVVVGAGPNGLAAAARLVQEDWSVLVLEARDTVGGGSRTAPLIRGDVLHDVCSAIHPFGAGSPFFDELPLADHGLEWVHPDAPLAHPIEGRPAGVLERDLADPGNDATLGADAGAWRDLVGPFVDNWDGVRRHVLGPAVRLPRQPLLMARFGLLGLRSAEGVAARFRGERARALFAGLAAHAILPLTDAPTGAVGAVFATTVHAVGWPFARGGSQAIADALASFVTSRGGRIVTGEHVASVDGLPPARAVLLDVSPGQFLDLAGHRASPAVRRRYGRFRHGPGVCKVDYVLSDPLPWADPACARAATVHVGGTFEEVAAAEASAGSGRHPRRPFVLTAQHSRFDPSRAPEGLHTLWAYCHVPAGSTVDMSDAIDAQIERFAPGFRDVVVDRHVLTSRDLQDYNPNYVGGDISGGSSAGLQAVFRPKLSLYPYATGVDGIYLCSASTPPGGGVHGMCGYHAAEAVLADARGGLAGRLARLSPPPAPR